MRVSHAVRVAAALTAAFAIAVPASARAGQCAPWTMRTVASGLGSLENIEPDRTGGMLLSASDHDAVQRLTPDGRITTVTEGMNSPGGLRVRGRYLFANTGDSLQSGFLGTADGTIERIDLRTGKRETYAAGIVMPNGLVFGPNGDAYTSRDVPNGAITRISAKSRQPETWADIPDSNGLAIDPSGKWLYVATTFNLDANVFRVLLADPHKIELVAKLFELGIPKGLDDMTIDASGVLYITANGAGQIIKLDPRTGNRCVIGSGMRNTSAVKFGAGPGWRTDSLYAVGFDGVVREFTPPR